MARTTDETAEPDQVDEIGEFDVGPEEKAELLLELEERIEDSTLNSIIA